MRIVFLSKPALLRAYEEAKKFNSSKNPISEDYV